MGFKKYIGVIAFIIALLGIAHQQNVEVHNQELVLQFNETNRSNVDVEEAILILKEELQQLGVTDAKVVENDNGKLKITYYSDADVSAVKKILLKKIRSELNSSDDDESPFKFPAEEHSVAYDLDVHEIQNANETDSGLNGLIVLEFKPKSDRFSKPETLSSTIEDYAEKDNVSYKVAFNLHKSSLHALNNALQQIPEVRAGPTVVSGQQV